MDISSRYRAEMDQNGLLVSEDATADSDSLQEHISTGTGSSKRDYMSRVDVASEGPNQGSLITFEAARELRLLDPNVNTPGNIVLDDDMPSSSPTNSPQEDAPWIDWQTVQTTIVEVLDDNGALPTDDHTSEGPEGRAQYSSYFQQQHDNNSEVYSSTDISDECWRRDELGYTEDPCESSPPSSSPPNLFTSSPTGSDDSVDELDEEPEPTFDKVIREETKTQEAEMSSNLQPYPSVCGDGGDTPDKTYIDSYQDNDLEQDELEDEETPENVVLEKTQDEIEMASDLQPYANIPMDAEDTPDRTFIGYQGDEMKDNVEDATDNGESLGQSVRTLDTEGDQRMLLDELSQPLPEANERERAKSPEIENTMAHPHTEVVEEEERSKNELPPGLGNMGEQPGHPIHCDEEEPQNDRQESGDKLSSPLPYIDTPEYLTPSLGVQDVASTLLVSSLTSSPALTEAPTAKQGEFIPTGLQECQIEGDSGPEASLPEYEEPPVVNMEAYDFPPDHLFHLEHRDDAWTEANGSNSDNGQKDVKPNPPPNPKRQTLASQKRQHKKLIKPFRSPFVGKSVQIAPNPPQQMDLRDPKSRPMQPQVKEKFKVAPKTMVRHRTVRAAAQFKSPLSAETSSQVVPSIRMTPTIQMLERKVQILRRAVKIQEEDDEGNLEAVAKKWREAAREVAWEVWEVVKDSVTEQKNSPWGKFEEEDKGKKRSFDESWGWGDQGEAKAPRLKDDEGNTDHDDAGSVDVEFKLTKSIAEEEEHRDTLGTMLRQLGIAPETLGWNDDQGTFEDD